MDNLLCPECESIFGKPLLDDDLSCPVCEGRYVWEKQKEGLHKR